jgi:hypothetical protein
MVRAYSFYSENGRVAAIFFVLTGVPPRNSR